MNDAERSAVAMLVGSIVHRAVLWPMLRPVTADRLDAFEDAEFLTERAAVALAVLKRRIEALVANASDERRDDLLATVNLEGPWDTGSFEPLWEALRAPAQRELLRRLEPLVTNAARAVSNVVRSRSVLGDRVVCAWSEVPLFAVDGFFRPADGELTRMRADLVVWRERGDIEVVDLKVRSTNVTADVRDDDRAQIGRYVEEVRRRVPADRRVRGTLLSIGSARSDTKIIRL